MLEIVWKSHISKKGILGSSVMCTKPLIDVYLTTAKITRGQGCLKFKKKINILYFQFLSHFRNTRNTAPSVIGPSQHSVMGQNNKNRALSVSTGVVIGHSQCRSKRSKSQVSDTQIMQKIICCHYAKYFSNILQCYRSINY